MIESTQEVRKYENRHGIVGLLGSQAELDEFNHESDKMDFLKEKSLEEITNLIKSIKETIENKKDVLKPLVEEHKVLKLNIKELEEQINKRKHEFENQTAKQRLEYSNLENEYVKISNNLYELKLSKDSYFEKTKILSRFNDLLDHEGKCLKGVLSYGNGFKSYSDHISNEIEENEQKLVILKKKREDLKEEANSAVDKNITLESIKFILEQKLKSMDYKKENSNMTNKREKYNRVILD
mgnify:FL=1